ncbi:MAG TPA: DUF1361 domain-containing protein [Candidatus Saccharimonadales bacterium]|nr:DUF1361 domain-containing protein [Candidatus Saccharimonadales bacterium]
MRFYFSARLRLGLALAGSSLVSISLFLTNAHTTHSWALAYMNWDLFLAWIPLLLSLWLARALGHKLWSSWQTLLITVLWLCFLPNSFYMISDFIHIQDVSPMYVLSSTIMLSSFILNGIVLGYLSLFLIHQELLKRVSQRLAAALIGAVLVLCSFAIYLGRDLRWNSWDIVRDPSSVLVDIANHLANPLARSDLLATTFGFSLLLGSLYVVLWYIARNLRQLKT